VVKVFLSLVEAISCQEQMVAEFKDKVALFEAALERGRAAHVTDWPATKSCALMDGRRETHDWVVCIVPLL
jgi:hypothetical protein